MPPRRFLPPLPWLTAFEAVARLGSVTEAAGELNLTQGAVSRQLQKLEAQLGVELFLRQRKRLILTEAGQIYGEEIREAIGRIASATIRATTNPEGGVLELAILPAFGTHWLAPRLPAFLAAHPGITLNLTTRTRPFDFSTQRLHAAIHFGRDNWPATGALKLAEEDLLPVMAPGLVPGGREVRAKDLAQVALLHLESRRRAWPQWFGAHGLEGAARAGMVFDQFATMQQAALAGLGAALLPQWLVAADLAAGRLVMPHATQPARIGAYWLVWPLAGAAYPPLSAFRNWVRQQTSEEI